MTSILIIEDQVSLREHLVELLTLENFDTLSAEDGLEGVELARRFLPDIIICDVMMPKMDGYQVLRVLSEEPTTAAIPFIFLTALADNQSNRLGMSLGADDFITKPFLPRELVKAIRIRLEKRSAIASSYEQKLERIRRNLVHALPHELRTPLTGILGCAEFLLLETAAIEPERVHNVALIIERSAKRLQQLIEDYLLYAQLEIASTDPQRIELLRQEMLFAPASVIHDAAEHQAGLHAREKDLYLNVQNAVVAISEENFSKIVEELIDNACKFSPLGTPVTVEAGVLSDTHYRLAVYDRGRGMKPEEIRDIGAYVQFERTLYEQQGVGLGLILVRRLAEIHGGELIIHSEPEKGSAVQVLLPLHSSAVKTTSGDGDTD